MTGEGSPECVGGEWASGEPGTTGATFKGHNRFRDDLWTTERDNSGGASM
ncbi:hypothetical protein [Saccharopolyspora sp. ASAGF58]|nr:hypothetical protein [Saccharopolyspora sp. ASAGF58]